MMIELAKNDREIRRLDYMDRWYPLVATGLVKMSVNEFLQNFKSHMIEELGSYTEEDIAWAEQYIAEIEVYNHSLLE